MTRWLRSLCSRTKGEKNGLTDRHVETSSIKEDRDEHRKQVQYELPPLESEPKRFHFEESVPYSFN
jgi:hypothetical protein